jgi:hypothetical protein
MLPLCRRQENNKPGTATMYEFTKQAKKKGYLMKEIASRWNVTPRRMSQIASDPKAKDWDALEGLPKK